MRVLVVEDEPELREAIGRRLRAMGHGVDEAADGASAGALLAVHDHAVVILDRLLPDGDSVERLRAWRAQGIVAPVLMLTALDRVGDRVEGLGAGADDYLVKPFAMAELLARVAAISRRQPLMVPAVLRVQNLEIDTSRREVRRNGVLIPLRPKEYELLELLLRQAGRVVVRSEIIRACWDELHEPLSNVEEALVASLRRKLGRPPVILTVRGAGYMIERDSGDAADG